MDYKLTHFFCGRLTKGFRILNWDFFLNRIISWDSIKERSNHEGLNTSEHFINVLWNENIAMRFPKRHGASALEACGQTCTVTALLGEELKHVVGWR